MGIVRAAKRLARKAEVALFESWRLESAFRAASAGRDTPILVGPWVSEVGFELLYWIPLLRKRFARLGVDPQRVVAVSRGGAARWYEGIAERYVDLFDLVSVDEFLHGNEARESSNGEKKQFAPSRFERELIHRVQNHLGLQRCPLLHPSAMYRYFRSFWLGLRGEAHVLEACDFSPLPARYPPPSGLSLPENYVAAKFYFSDCFPRSEANLRFVEDLLTRLAEQSAVVLLNTGLALDDHRDSGPLRHPNIVDASQLMTPSTNLDLQSALVARSRGLVATYGGFSYLGPLLGVPAMGIYSERNFQPSHLALAEAALNRSRPGLFSVLSTSDALSQAWRGW